MRSAVTQQPPEKTKLLLAATGHYGVIKLAGTGTRTGTGTGIRTMGDNRSQLLCNVKASTLSHATIFPVPVLANVITSLLRSITWWWSNKSFHIWYILPYLCIVFEKKNFVCLELIVNVNLLNMKKKTVGAICLLPLFPLPKFDQYAPSDQSKLCIIFPGLLQSRIINSTLASL